MKPRTFTLALVVLLSAAPAAFGQAVQLPTFDFFTVNTTVSVPDGGTAYLGGINSYSAGQNSGGVPMVGNMPFIGRPFGNRAISSNVGASSVTATARIIIPEEEEAKLGLAGLGAGRAEALSAVEQRANFLARNVARHNTGSPDTVAATVKTLTPEEIHRRNELASQQRSQEAVFFFEKGDAAFAAGKTNVAKIYYRMAANRAAGELKDRVLAKLHTTLNADSLSAGAP